MKLGTSTNLLFSRPNGQVVPLESSLEQISKAGFTSLDFNSYDWTLEGSPLLRDDWEKWIDLVSQKAKELKITFDQCHAYFYSFLDENLTEEKRQYHEKMQKRSFECCAKLGAKTIVLHPETDYSTFELLKNSKEKNAVYYKRILNETKQYSFNFAIENMVDFGIAPKRKFCATPEELVNFIDDMKEPRLGICWDFEHADIMRQNQTEALRLIGKRLYATHVSDTYSKKNNKFMHTLPMTSGTINWQAIMPVLKEIGYEGIFCFEVHNFLNRLPDVAVPTALKLAYEIGDYLLKLV